MWPVKTGTAVPTVFHGKGYNTACLSSPGSATPITFQDKGGLHWWSMKTRWCYTMWSFKTCTDCRSWRVVLHWLSLRTGGAALCSLSRQGMLQWWSFKTRGTTMMVFQDKGYDNDGISRQGVQQWWSFKTMGTTMVVFQNLYIDFFLPGSGDCCPWSLLTLIVTV